MQRHKQKCNLRLQTREWLRSPYAHSFCHLFLPRRHARRRPPTDPHVCTPGEWRREAMSVSACESILVYPLVFAIRQALRARIPHPVLPRERAARNLERNALAVAPWVLV